MLTPTQLSTLRAAILAETDALFVQYRDLGVDSGLAQFYNEVASPAYIVWRTSVDPDEIMRNGMDWTRVDNLSVGKARIWDWLTRLGTFDPSRANIRAGIDAAWVGTAADLAVRATVYTHCKRGATRGEKLFASGAGSDASPSVLGFEGEVMTSDISAALTLAP